MVVVLLLLSFVCFILATFGIPTGRVSILALGLVFLVAAMLVGPLALMVR